MRLIAKPELKQKREDLCTQQEMTSLIKTQTGRSFRRNYYTLIENQERSVDSELALAIARILESEVDEVFEGKDQHEERDLMEEIDENDNTAK